MLRSHRPSQQTLTELSLLALYSMLMHTDEPCPSSSALFWLEGRITTPFCLQKNCVPSDMGTLAVARRGREGREHQAGSGPPDVPRCQLWQVLAAVAWLPCMPQGQKRAQGQC